MKTTIFRLGIIIFPLLIFLCRGLGESGGSKSDIVANINARVLRGENAALDEAAKLPANVGIPLLHEYISANREKKGGRFTAARNALLRITHYEKYYIDRIAVAAGNESVDVEAFETLAAIDTPEAAAVVAPYLFNFGGTSSKGDIGAEINAISAMASLDAMTIPDAPTHKQPEGFKIPDFLAWQKWAINKGFVPASTKTYTPQWLVDLVGPEPHSPRVEPPATAGTSSQSPALPTVGQMSSLAPTTVESPVSVVERKMAIWPWVAGILVAVVIVALTRKRRL